MPQSHTKVLEAADLCWSSGTDEQSVVKVRLHSTSDASSRPALLLPHIQAVLSVVAPCPRGASLVSVRRRTFTCASRIPNSLAESRIEATLRGAWRLAHDNEVRSHASLKGHTPLTFAGGHMVARAELNNVS